MIFIEKSKTYLVSFEEEIKTIYDIDPMSGDTQIKTPFLSSLPYIDGIIDAEYDFSSTQNVFITVESKADMCKIQKQIKKLWKQQ